MIQVFLSHSTSDQAFIDWLVTQLHDAGITVWKAPESIEAGEDWIKGIQRGLTTSSHFVLVKSPSAVTSTWVDFEFSSALRLYHDQKLRIIPILYEACDEPFFWGSFQHVDMRDQSPKRLAELIMRLNNEQPADLPTPTPSTEIVKQPRKRAESKPKAKTPPSSPKPVEPTPVASLGVLDRFKNPPPSDTNSPFLMPIEDIFALKERGVVALGVVERGIGKVGDAVEIVGLGETRRAVISGFEAFSRQLSQVGAGDKIGILLGSLVRENVETGMVIAAPGSIKAYRRFACEIYMLRKDEGGRSQPFSMGDKPTFFFRTSDIAGEIDLTGSTPIPLGGEGLVAVKLSRSVALEKGTRFSIRENGRVVAVGIVKLPTQ